MASTQISAEANHSRRSPRSSSICNPIMPSKKVAKPKKSRGGFCSAPFSESHSPHCQEDEARHRQADIEDRAPAVIFAEPAADARAADDAQHQANGPHQTNAGVLLIRIS